MEWFFDALKRFKIFGGVETDENGKKVYLTNRYLPTQDDESDNRLRYYFSVKVSKEDDED